MSLKKILNEVSPLCKRSIELEYDSPFRRNIPKKLFKVFDNPKYADDFLQGRVFFRALTSLRKIETAGADPDEGQPKIEHGPAKVTLTNSKTGEVIAVLDASSTKIGWQTDDPRSRFVSCFSSYTEAPQTSKFGKYIVEIFDAPAMISNWMDCLGALEFGPIEYFDPENIDAIKAPAVPPWHLKSSDFADEQEFRVSFEIDNLDQILSSIDPTDYGVSDNSQINVEALPFSFGSNQNWARLL